MNRRPLADLHDPALPSWLQDILGIAIGLAMATALLLAMASG